MNWRAGEYTISVVDIDDEFDADELTLVESEGEGAEEGADAPVASLKE